MKNKHLLLLFLCTLLAGWALRNLPWLQRKIFQTELIALPPGDLRHISLRVPGAEELVLEKTDEHWVAFQSETAIPVGDSMVTDWLHALQSIRSIRILNGARPDTLGLAPEQSIALEALLSDGRRERMDIGREITNGNEPGTYVRIGSHGGIYLVEGFLRRLFNRSVEDFRDQTPVRFDAWAWKALWMGRPGGDTVQLVRQGSAFVTEDSAALTAPMDSLARWASLLSMCNQWPQAAGFDESQEAYCRVLLHAEIGAIDSTADQWLQVFEVPGSLRTGKSPALGRYLLHHSLRPAAYFNIPDSLTLGRIVKGPRTTARD